jgi:hypothetical protein
VNDARSITPVPVGAPSRRRGRTLALVLALGALAACILLALAGWWLYPRLFPVQAVDLQPGDSYVAGSGLTIRVPGTQPVQAFRERRPEASAVGIADSLELASLRSVPDATVFSYSHPEKNKVITNVGKLYALAGESADGVVEVRWHDWGSTSALAIVTRVPGHDPGLVLTLATPRLGTADAARATARRLWSELSVQGARLP